MSYVSHGSAVDSSAVAWPSTIVAPVIDSAGLLTDHDVDEAADVHSWWLSRIVCSA